jgi:hypothetical protein
MTISGPRWRKAPGWAAGVLLFGVLAGLVGMHGLSAHCTQAMGAAAMPAAPTGMSTDAGDDGPSPGGGGHAESIVPDSDGGGAHVVQPPGDEHEASAFVMVCVGVVAVALVAFTMRVRRLGRPWVVQRRRRPLWLPLRWPIRAPSPPILTLLSIRRC